MLINELDTLGLMQRFFVFFFLNFKHFLFRLKEWKIHIFFKKIIFHLFLFLDLC